MDVVDLRTFYNQELGQLVRRQVGDQIQRLIGPVSGLAVAGIGFATPYLRPFKPDAERVLALMPAAQGVLHWPPEGRFASTLVHDDALPLPDTCIDKLICVHALEMTESADDHLREIWRVLMPGGRLILVVPNRRGLWARFDNTPFGHGRPFSRSQIAQLLQGALLTPESWSETLYVPPIARRSVLRAAGFFEKVGRGFPIPVGGVLIVEASKQIYQRAAQQARRRFSVRIAPVLNPRPATRVSAAIRTSPPKRSG